jgi:HSP20 family protein
MATHRIRGFFEPSLVPPWHVFDEIQRDFAGLFNAAVGTERIRAWASDDAAFIEIDAAGIDPATCDISVEDDTVSITIPAVESQTGEDARFYLRERSQRRLSQQIRLPFALDAAKTNATYSDGVLRLSLSRREDSKPVRVQIQAN